MSSELKLFDSELAVTQAGGDSELADELFGMLLNELTDYHQKIETQLKEREYTQLLETVHKLNGATRYTGVPALSAAANQFEQAIRSDANSHYDELYRKLIHEINRLKDVYQKN